MELKNKNQSQVTVQKMRSQSQTEAKGVTVNPEARSQKYLKQGFKDHSR